MRHLCLSHEPDRPHLVAILSSTTVCLQYLFVALRYVHGDDV